MALTARPGATLIRSSARSSTLTGAADTSSPVTIPGESALPERAKRLSR